ncbi:hypothetical protein HanXRQr2_Chr09g0372151 [Helianthus annuus]|uniref:Uncharacterized protein n=1 Tax=Helianthus annuus TaxID=4232 RepID=A0A9K3N797_HELAN|nr:hypothetical protein HanXRQr2_Chr09g0372151 [Helianthus annuus]
MLSEWNLFTLFTNPNFCPHCSYQCGGCFECELQIRSFKYSSIDSLIFKLSVVPIFSYKRVNYNSCPSGYITFTLLAQKNLLTSEPPNVFFLTLLAPNTNSIHLLLGGKKVRKKRRVRGQKC